MVPEAERALLVFYLSGQAAAFPLENIESVASMALLASPPGTPASLEGVLNLAGVAVPVLRLDRLLRLPEHRPSMYSMLILLRGVWEGRVAVLVDRASEILSVPESALLPLGDEHSFNACAVSLAHACDSRRGGHHLGIRVDAARSRR